MDIAKLQELLVERCREHFDGVHAWGPLEWSACITAAAGKATDLCRRLQLGEPVNPDVIAKELGTTVIYACLAASSIQADLSDAIREEFNRKSAEIGSLLRL